MNHTKLEDLRPCKVNKAFIFNVSNVSNILNHSVQTVLLLVTSKLIEIMEKQQNMFTATYFLNRSQYFSFMNVANEDLAPFQFQYYWYRTYAFFFSRNHLFYTIHQKHNRKKRRWIMMFYGEKEAHLKYFFNLVFRRTKCKTNVKQKILMFNSCLLELQLLN